MVCNLRIRQTCILDVLLRLSPCIPDTQLVNLRPALITRKGVGQISVVIRTEDPSL